MVVASICYCFPLFGTSPCLPPPPAVSVNILHNVVHNLGNLSFFLLCYDLDFLVWKSK